MRLRPLVLVAVVLASPLVACSGDRGTEPTLPTVELSPRLVVSVDDDGFSVERGDTDDPAITADPPAAPTGTVIEVRNDGDSDNRVSDDDTIDTGVMRPGDTTTVVLTSEGPLELRDASGHALTIDVTADAG